MPHSNSLRPQHTVEELSKVLHLTLNTKHLKGDETKLAKDVLTVEGPVLIAWEHEHIPAIVNAIVGNETTCPQHWKDARFDLVWVLDQAEAQIAANGDGFDPPEVKRVQSWVEPVKKKITEELK